MSGLKALGQLWCGIQRWLFPALREELGELGEKHREFIAVCETSTPQNHLAAYRWVGIGCPPKDRLAVCKAFIAKAVWDFPTTRALLDRVRNDPTLRRLCGWETTGQVPSESTFSRAFAAFATGQLPQTIHAAMLKTRYGDKLAGHLSRVSSDNYNSRLTTIKNPGSPGPRAWPASGAVFPTAFLWPTRPF
jgi:hypothetical protein